ncbi:MAG: aldehyde ferredoxin oxidoreductase family protein [Nitrososphaerota archaeon]|nr:aldehyde ferredoxin oxidoreductase family protein [Nitrososphaerota archaeon]
MSSWIKGGWVGRILTIDLTKGRYYSEELPKDLAMNYIGGRGFGAKILWDRLPPKVDPLSPDNLLVISSGPLSGLPLPCSGKLDIETKSPLTGGWADSNCGSIYNPAFKRAGMDVLILKGRCEKPTYIHIQDGDVKLRDASHLWGKGVFETDKILRKDHGKSNLNLIIGPAGERLVRFASLMAESGRAAGRSGIGAVMGSKNIKALCISGSKEIPVADPDGLRKITDEAHKELRKSPMYDMWMRQGTMFTIDWSNENSCLPTRNMKESMFERANEIDGNRMEELKVGVSSCFGCVMACGHITRVNEGRYAGLEVVPDYENVAMLGSGCGIAPLEPVLKMNYICDDLGMDTISAGSVISFAMECYERGLIDKTDLDGLELKFGNEDAAIKLLEMIGYRIGFGDLLAEGVRNASKKIGKGSEKFAMHVKGMEISAYESRAAPGMALAYGTSDIGAHHKRCFIISWEVKNDRLGISKEKVAKVIELQNIRSSFDMMSVCRFPFVELDLPYDYYSKFMTLATGYPFTTETILKAAERVFCLTRAFWVRELGYYSRELDYVPPRWFEEPLPNGPFKGHRIKLEDYDKLLSWYYELRGFDERGIPKREKLIEMGLDDVVKTFEYMGIWPN